ESDENHPAEPGHSFHSLHYRSTCARPQATQHAPSADHPDKWTTRGQYPDDAAKTLRATAIHHARAPPEIPGLLRSPADRHSSPSDRPCRQLAAVRAPDCDSCEPLCETFP